MKVSYFWIVLGGVLFTVLAAMSYLSPVSGSTTTCVVPPTGLVSWWRAELNANDSTGDNHGILNAGAYEAGMVGQTFSFDGSQGYVTVPDAPALDGQSAISLEAWIKPASLGWPNPDPNSDYEAAIVTKYDSTFSDRRSYVFALTDGHLKLTVFGGANEQRAVANAPLPIGSWSHVAAVWDGSSIQLFVDGTTVTTTVTGTSPSQINDSITPLNIGRVESYSGTYTGPAAFFHGFVDEASLYDRALTPSEIAATAAAGADGKCLAAATSTPTATASPSATPTATATRDPFTHLPFFIRSLPPTATPTATPTMPAGPVIANGGFEQGHVAWTEYSAHGYDIILHEDDIPVDAHNGSWATWFGGDYDEASIIEQQITVPTGRFILTYWLWIASQDYCDPDYDIAGVLVNDDAVDAYLLCDANDTNGWIRRSVNLSTFAGQRVTLTFAAFTDGTLNSNLFIDDVDLQRSAAPETRLPSPASPSAVEVRRRNLEAGSTPLLPSKDYRDILGSYLNDGRR